MSDIIRALKSEIIRLAKKESKAQITPLKSDVVKLKKSNVALRKTIKQLTNDNSFLLAAEKRRQLETPVVKPESAAKGRISSKGVKAMRKKLDLSQVEFAQLLNVSDMTIFNWENKAGKLKLRDNAKAAILALRGVSKKEAKRRLELLAVKKVKPAKKVKKSKKLKKAIKKGRKIIKRGKK